MHPHPVWQTNKGNFKGKHYVETFIKPAEPQAESQIDADNLADDVVERLHGRIKALKDQVQGSTTMCPSSQTHTTQTQIKELKQQSEAMSHHQDLIQQCVSSQRDPRVFQVVHAPLKGCCL